MSTVGTTNDRDKVVGIVLAHQNRGFVEEVFHLSLIRHPSLTTKRPLLIITKPGRPTTRISNEALTGW